MSESCKSPANVFLKKGKNPVITLQYGEEGTKFKVISVLVSPSRKIICKDQYIIIMMMIMTSRKLLKTEKNLKVKVLHMYEDKGFESQTKEIVWWLK